MYSPVAPANRPRRSTRASRSGRLITSLAAEAALIRIASAIADCETPTQVAEAVVGEVRRLVPCDRGAVGLWLRDRDEIQLVAASSDERPTRIRTGLVVPIDDTALRAVLESRRSLREGDLTTHHTGFERALAAEGIHSRLAVPVVVRGSAVAFLGAAACERNTYAPEHQRLLEHLAVHLAVGLEQARLLESTRRHEERLLGLQRVAQRLMSSAAGEDVLDTVLEEAVRSVGGDTGTLWMWDPERQVQIALRNTVPTAQEYKPVPLGSGVGGRAMLHRQVVVLNDYQKESGDETPAGKTGVRAAIGAPLIADGELLGAVTSNTLDPSKRFDESDRQVFELLAGLAAAVITTNRVFESERRQREQAEAMAEIAHAITSTIELSEVLDLALDKVSEIMKVPCGIIYLRDQTDMLRLAAHRGFSRAYVDGVACVRLGEGAVGKVAQSGQPEMIDDLEQYANIARPVVRREGIRSVLLVPLQARKRVIGTIYVATYQVQPFSADQANLLKALGQQIAVAIENAELLHAATSRARELEVARQQAEEASRLKSQFLASMSHELRTPLNSIIGYSQLMLDGLDGDLGDQQRRDLGRVLSSGEHLLGLINDILDLSKIEAGRFEVFPEPLLLADVVQSALASIEPLARKKGLELRPSLPADLPLVLADPDRLRQVLLNLLSNAVKFTDAGQVLVRAEAVGSTIQVTVADTGPGISAAACSYIFESFRQADGSSTRRHGGTGLGLAIARQLLELQGGWIRVKSVVGEGSEFTFGLPSVSPESLSSADGGH